MNLSPVPMNVALKIPTVFPLLAGGTAVGIFAFWNECPQTIFPLWVLISKRAGIPKGTAFPWREASNGGQRPPWREESNETGGFVAHDLARKV